MKLQGTGTKTGGRHNAPTILEEDVDVINVLDDLEDEASEYDPTAICISHWCNAGPEVHKQMFEMFDETGLFLCVCRHGIVLLMCDMIRSGELWVELSDEVSICLILFYSTKYGLALINWLLDVFGSCQITLSYNIACAFWKTLMDSSIGPKAHGHAFCMMVSSFHGHSHHHGCQVNWHPLYVKGSGRADFEGCEQVFEKSNELAPATRHASKIHRHQAIEEHMKHWDEDKYANLCLYPFYIVIFTC